LPIPFLKLTKCIIIWPPGVVRSIVIITSVCMSLCVSVCPRVYLRNHTRSLYQNFCACCLWPWLGPPPAS